MRHGESRAVELCRQAHLEAAVPVLRVDLLDAPGRPRDAGVVHQHVEPAERLQPLVEEAGCVGSVRHFARRVRQVGIARGQAVERRSINVSDMNARAPRTKVRAISSPIPFAPAVTSTRKPSIPRSMAKSNLVLKCKVLW